MSNWVFYKNGNYTVKFNTKDGTKIRETEDDEFIPSFAENMDVKITDKCDGNCAFCYEGCTPEGKHGDIMNYKFLDKLHPYTEMAINGNDMSHPDLIPFLKKMKKKKVFVNMTVNQIHFERHYELIKELYDNKLIYGIGVSLVNPTDEFIELVKELPTAVIHTINGILTKEQVEKMSNKGLKLLVLGYKQLKRGKEYYSVKENDVVEKQKWLYDNIEDMVSCFKVISFDNLAIEQLKIKRIVPDEQWEEFYMGDDGDFTFYVDLVKGQFCKNSCVPENERYEIQGFEGSFFDKICNKR